MQRTEHTNYCSFIYLCYNNKCDYYNNRLYEFMEISSYQMNQRTNDIEPEIAASVKVYVSVMTQTSANL